MEMADLNFGLLMPLIIGLRWVNLFWLISCYWGVWDMVFCLRLTGHWFGGLPYKLYNFYTKCVCWEDTALKTVGKWFCFISFNALIYFGDFFFIYPWALWVDPLPTFFAAYPIYFILFSASCIPYYSRFSLWLIFVIYGAYTVTVFRVTFIALPC